MDSDKHDESEESKTQNMVKDDTDEAEDTPKTHTESGKHIHKP